MTTPHISCPKGLRNLYHEGRLIPFVGAGVSASVSWQADGRLTQGPTWSQLVDEAARMMGFDDADLLRVRGTDLQILEYFRIIKHDSFGELNNWLVRRMAVPDDALKVSTVHRKLAELEKCGVIYTTNYDDLIERALRIHGRPAESIVRESHIGQSLKERVGGGRARGVEVVKFHGDLSVPETMVLSDADYERRLTLQDSLDHRLHSDVLGRALLFLGYSFRDWNVSYLFRLVNDTFKDLPDSDDGRRAYITVADPSNFELQLFRKRNIEVIPISGSRLTQDVGDLLDAMSAPQSA